MAAVVAPFYSAQERAVTQRPVSTAILAIDSEDRFRDYDESRGVVSAVPNYSPYDFTINKSQSLMNGFFTRLGVTELVFPWMIPNINRQTYLMGIEYDIGAGPVEDAIDLDEGFYTPSMIAAAIQAKVRAIAPAAGDLGSFTMTYGIATIGQPTTTQRPIFEYKTNNASTVAFSPVGFGIYADRRRKQLFDLLGFTGANEALSIEDDGTDTFCQYTRYVDIVCTQLTANQALKDTMSQTVARDVLCRVYVGDAVGSQSTVLPSSSTFCPPGCMPTTIYKDFAQPKQIQWLPNQPVPGVLRFEVFDDAGNGLNSVIQGVTTAGNGANWSMTLLVSEN